MSWKPGRGWTAGVGVLLLCGAVGFGCRSVDTDPSVKRGMAAPGIPPSGAAQLQLSGVLEDGMRVVKVRARKFEFVPGKIVVNEGDKVRIDLTSEDVTHGFSMGHFKIDQVVEPGKTVSVKFTADKAGTFGFHCSVFCGMGHMKMRGDVVVLPHKT